MKYDRSLQVPQKHATAPYPEPDESTPSSPVHLRTILILSSHLHLILPRCLFPFSLSNKTFYALLFSPPRHIFPSHFVLHDLILMLSFHLRVGLPSGHFLTSPTRILCFSPPQCVLHFPPISSFLMYHPNNICWSRHIMNPTPSYTLQVSCNRRSHFSPRCSAGALWLGGAHFKPRPVRCLPWQVSFWFRHFPQAAVGNVR